MRKLFVFFFLIFFSFSLEIINSRARAFVGSFSPTGCIMTEAAFSPEVWIYPYKVLEDFRFNVIMEGSEFSSEELFYLYKITPQSFSRLFLHSAFVIEEKAFPSLRKPWVYVIYKIKTTRPLSLIFSFKPVLQPMWPACIGGKFSFWHEDLKAFVITESSWKNSAIAGFGKGTPLGKLPAHKLPGGYVRFEVEVSKGTTNLPFVIIAGRKRPDELEPEFKKALKNWKEEKKHREKEILTFFSKILKIHTPNKVLNQAFLWATYNLHSALIKNLQLGEGLIAGYGLSRGSERPGFAWFFGGDALINSLAILDYGDFESVKKALSFLLRYQREDGKIMHELSQGAGFVNWFEDYGFGFFHGDTTLYFVVSFSEYVRRTGDTDFVKKHWKKLEKIYRWMEEVDSNEDGIAETSFAGTGASETGPLRQEMHTDILLAGLSAKAWEDMVWLASLIGKTKIQKKCLKKADKARNTLEKLFWNKEKHIYAYAIKPSFKQIEELTIWPAIAMSFGVLDSERGRIFGEKIASPALSTDWGTRFLSKNSPFYDPISYNNGAVWPFLTGFASLALFKYENPYGALDLLLANAANFFSFNPGYSTELISGAFYKELEQSVPNQIWSSGNYVSPLIKGLFGLTGDAVRKEIYFQPTFPALWNKVYLSGYRVGKGELSFTYLKTGSKLIFSFSERNLKGYRLKFFPLLWIGTQVSSVKVNGREIVFDVDSFGGRTKLWTEFQLDGPTEVVITLKKSGFDFIIEKSLHPGQSSEGLRFSRIERAEKGWKLSLWGKDRKTLKVFSPQKLICKGCSESRKLGECLQLFEIDFGQTINRKTIKLYTELP